MLLTPLKANVTIEGLTGSSSAPKITSSNLPAIASIIG